MLQRLKISTPAFALVIVLLILMVLVRVFQEQLFYDPLISFFRKEEKILPMLDTTKLFLGLLFRYAINTAISIGILYILFKDKSLIKVVTLLYAGLFAILAVAFFIVFAADKPNLLVLFYIRRFIIQPLFLFLFLPALYYQKNVK